jgi:hypothetical protein
MDYDAVMMKYPGHAAVGVDIFQATGNYEIYQSKKYYFCETTNDIKLIGDMASKYKASGVDQIIQVN